MTDYKNPFTGIRGCCSNAIIKCPTTLLGGLLVKYESSTIAIIRINTYDTVCNLLKQFSTNLFSKLFCLFITSPGKDW